MWRGVLVADYNLQLIFDAVRLPVFCRLDARSGRILNFSLQRLIDLTAGHEECQENWLMPDHSNAETGTDVKSIESRSNALFCCNAHRIVRRGVHRDAR